MAAYRVVGKPVPRVDGPEKVTGRTLYAADLNLPRMLHAKVVRSPHAHARICDVDTAEALRLPGVVTILTGRDLTEVDDDPSSLAHTLLARRRVVFAGQPVAAVVAEDVHTAEAAARLVKVTYEVQPAAIDPVEALKPGAPLVGEQSGEVDRSAAQAHATVEVELKESEKPSNASSRLAFRRGDVAQGFAESDVVIERTYRVAAVHQGYLEPHATIAAVDASGRLTIWAPTQGQFALRSEVANVLKLPETSIRIIGMEVGGGFGGKMALLAPLVALLARRTRRPVKLVLTRTEELQAAPPSLEVVITLKTGARRDGTVTALQARVICDSGAFPGAPLANGCLLLGGSYKFAHLEVEGIEVLTHKIGVGWYRAPGSPQAAFAIESQMDLMARELGLDPIAFRLQNAVEAGDPMPNGRPWRPIGLKQVLRRIQEHPIWQNRERRPNRGYGVAVGGWLGGLQPANATVKLNPDGTIGVTVGSIDITGTNTSLAQIAAEELGVPLEQVHIATDDTDTSPFGGQSGGSKITYTVGVAVKAAAEDARAQILAVAASELGAAPEDLEVVAGRVRRKDAPDQAIPFKKIGRITTTFGAKYAAIFGRGSSLQRRQSPGFACQAAEVEVDPDTGCVTVHRLVVAQDAGFAINPLSVEGQMQGGAAQGLGMGCCEELVYAPEGRLLNPSLLDYRLPTIADVPPIETAIVEVPSDIGPYGAKGVGEPSIVPGAAAIANAIHDAIGVRVVEAPATPERIVTRLAEQHQGRQTVGSAVSPV